MHWILALQEGLIVCNCHTTGILNSIYQMAIVQSPDKTSCVWRGSRCVVGLAFVNVEESRLDDELTADEVLLGSFS
jgi:hypothetical protein